PEKREAFQAEFLARFDAELAAIPPHVHTVIASSEHFHSRMVHDDEVEALRALLAPRFARTRVLTYLRRQVDAAVSSYTTFLISGGSGSMLDFVDRFCTPDNPYFDYERYLARWERAFARESVTVRIFEPDAFANGNLIDDFFLQIDPALVQAIDRNIEPRNESLDQFGQTLLDTVNRWVPRIIDGIGLNRVAVEIGEIVIEEAKGRSVALDDDSYARIQARFESGNEAVRRAWFPERAALFLAKPGRSGGVQVTPQQAATLDKVVEVLTRENRAALAKGAGAIPPAYASQIASLTRRLSDVEANRALVHGQLVAVTDDLVRVRENRDALRAHLDGVERELDFLRDKLVNRILLRLRRHFGLRSEP
ncbi:MAG: hypothetical protein ABW026_04515, partial [Microvirga sp.]